MKHTLFNVLIISALVLSLTSTAFAQEGEPPVDRLGNRELPESVKALKLDKPVTVSGGPLSKLDSSLAGAKGPLQVIVRLASASVAELDAAAQADRMAHKANLKADQASFLARAQAAAPGAQVLAQTQAVLNAVFLEVDGRYLEALAADPAVLRIHRVKDYELFLSETVPYIGASAVHASGYDGSGVQVAVLDSGIDYYHADLGGSGDPADYAADDPTLIEPGTFPTAKVVGGYDFVGSVWPFGALAPDPDPLDDGSAGGHGTHVADIIAGVGPHVGVAPGAELFAVKVCSSESTSCSGVALIQGMEFAVDPNSDGDTSDHVDIINMSLGSDYGQPFDDDLSLAVDNASALGVLTVAAAGNGADKPFIVATPSATSTALAVAQTNVPSAVLPLMEVTAPASIAGLYPAVFQQWSVPLTSVIGPAPLVYGDGAGGNLDGCAPFTNSLSGFVVLVDRGACNFTLKISNISQAGGLVGIIGLVAPGDPFSGGDGGDRPIDIPGYMISQSLSNLLKSGLPDTTVRFDPATGLPLIGVMVGSSSRGPQFQEFIVKPEIGAPGASVSAIYGTGSDTGPFGGTSGAAPMVSGSAALLLQAEPDLSPAEVKARLVTTADHNIINDALTGELAPVSRIGGGEVRADRAVNTKLAAWDDDSLLPTLSFGQIDVADKKEALEKEVRVQNYSDEDMLLTITPVFRFADDADSGAVQVEIKVEDNHKDDDDDDDNEKDNDNRDEDDAGGTQIRVEAGEDEEFEVKITIWGELLPNNFMNSGSQGANGSALTLNEFDGYLILDDGNGTTVHLPWHVLPRKAAEVEPDKSHLKGGGFPEVIGLENEGVGTAQNDAYALVGLSPDLLEGERGQQSPLPDLRAVGVNTFPVPAGFCSDVDSFVWAFAVNTWERQTHAIVPGFFWWDLDTDQDGVSDFAVFNWDASSPLASYSDGRNLAWAAAYDATGTSLIRADAFFFTEHATVTGNTVLYICAEQIGFTAADMLATHVDVTVYAIENYFTDDITDVIGPFTITPLGEQYFGLANDVPGNTEDDAGLAVYDFGPFPGNTPELGLMLFTNGDRGAGLRGGATHDSEALLFMAP